MTPEQAVAFVRERRERGAVIVFTNGVFDLLHPGHVRYLRQARTLGDVLIVGVNSDRSVRAIKGPSRPVTAEDERAEIVAALACVDAAVIFDDETPWQLIATLQPDVLVKGADWAEDAIVGRDIVEARGGRVVRLPIEAGHATTAIVDRIRQRGGPSRRDGRDWQAEIDRVNWYHEFDFGNGLRAQSRIENLDGVRQIWRFIERQLDRIDFAGKSVIDIGAWDGFWSFYAERRGAASVLATDDRSQNWAGGTGLALARELLHSNIDVRQDLPIYEVASLNRRFDIILCLGVFYHLRDPFFGFAQLRHCCHADTIVALEGELAWNGVTANEVRYFYNNWLEFLPSESALAGLLKSAYLQIESRVWLHEFPTEPSEHAPLQSDRAFVICRPFTGANEMYVYKPHFGLHVYDPRFATPDVARRLQPSDQ